MDESRSETRKATLKQRTEALVREMVEKGLLLEEAVAEFEKSFISAALERSEHNQCQAAKKLGLHRNTLRSKIRFHGLNGKRAS